MKKLFLEKLSRNKLFTLVLLLGFALVGFSSCEKDSDDDTTPEEEKMEGTDGDKAPDFSLQDTDGNTVKLADYDGKVVVLFFFGHSCPSCKAVGPSVQTDLVEAYANNSSFQVLALDQWNGNLASVQAFKQNTGLSAPTLLNAASTATAYSSTYDRLIVIGKDGVVKFTGEKNASQDLAAAKQIIDANL